MPAGRLLHRLGVPEPLREPDACLAEIQRPHGKHRDMFIAIDRAVFLPVRPDGLADGPDGRQSLGDAAIDDVELRDGMVQRLQLGAVGSSAR